MFSHGERGNEEILKGDRNMKRSDKRKERFQNIYQAVEPLRVAKKNTIHTLAGIGREHKILRYPMMVVLIAFIFFYNLFLYILMELKMEEKLARGVAVLMTGVLVITSIDLTALAMTSKEEDYYRVTALEEIDSSVVVPYGTDIDELELPESISVTMDRYSLEEIQQEAVEEKSVSESTEETSDNEAQGEESAEEPSDSEAQGEGSVEEPVLVEKVVETITEELPVTWKCADYDDEAPGQYLFTAEMPEEYNDCSLLFDDVTIPTVTVEVLEAEEMTLSATVDGMEITMVAAPKVFPAGAKLSVTKVDDAKSIAKIDQAVQNTLDKAVGADEETEVALKKTMTFDVTVLNKDGQEIQPEIPEGMTAQEAVTVTFKKMVPKLETELTEEEKEAEAQQSMEIFYVDDSMNTATRVESWAEGEELSFSPEHFSYYTCSCYVYNAKGIYDWKSLYKAVYSKDGTINVRLKEDISISKMSFYSNADRLVIKNGQKVNIDLYGHKLMGTVSGKPAIEVKDGVLNIHDSQGNGTISSRNGSYVIYANGSNATVNLLGGAIVRGGSEDDGIYVTNKSSVNIRGGAISGSFPYGIYFNASYRGAGSMSDGCIDGANYGVYIGGSSNRGTTFTMTGGTIQKCKSAGVYNNNGIVTMTGGKISGNSGYKAYGIMNTGNGQLKLGGPVSFENNRAADLYVGSSSNNLVTVTSALTGSRIGVATANAPTKDSPVRFTSNAYAEASMKQFYSAANSSYAIWQPVSTQGVSQNYYVVGPKENCRITVEPKNIKVSTTEEDVAGTVAIGTSAASTSQINTTVKYNASVTLKATLTNAEEYEFTGWKDRSGSIVSKSLVYTFTATNDNTYTAVFTKKKCKVTVASSDTARGTVAVTGYSLGSIPSDYKFEVGSTITIAATPKKVGSTQYELAQWNDGNDEKTRTIVVTKDAVYTAQFKEPDPDPNATGELFVGVTKLSSNPSTGTRLLVIGGGGSMTESSGMIAVAGLPADSARVTAVEDGTYSTSWGKSVVVGVDGSGGKQVTIDKDSSGNLYKGAAFDGCLGGLIRYYKGSWYYWCNGGAKVGIGPYNVYSYSSYTTFKASNVKASLNKLQLSADKNSVAEADITITVTSGSNTYTLKNLIFKDTAIDYSNGDRCIELNLGGVLFTYTLPEAIVVKSGGTRIEYDTLAKAVAAAQTGDRVYVVGSAISEITDELTQLKQGTTIQGNDGSKITAEEPSVIKATPDGTIELVKGQVTAEPSSDDTDVTVDVDGASVTAKEPITITAGGTDEEGNPTEPTVTTTEPTAEVIISPDGDPDHTVVYTGCPKGKEYGIHSGKLTDEEKVEIKSGTEYDLEVELGDNQKTNIETDGTNSGTTTVTKGKDENGNPDGSIVIESKEPNNDITVGDTKYTTSDEETKLIVKPSTGSGSEGSEGEEGTGKPEVELKEGSVQLPPEGTIILPNGDKVTNSTDSAEGSESVTVSDDNKVRIPAGAEATLGEGDDAIKVSVPKGENGEPDSLPAEVSPKEDGSGYEVKAEPGNDVTIGDETYRIGDYDTTFEVTPGEDGKPDIVVADGGVELQPGQSVTDSNGTKFTNNGDTPIKLSMTEGENTEVTLGEGDKFTYQPKGEEPQEFKNPGSFEADFSVSKEGNGVSLNSDVDVPIGEEVDVNFQGENIKIKVPEGNTGEVNINLSEGTVTIGNPGDKVIINGKEYTATEANTVIKPGQDGVELKEGGVSLDPKDSIVTGTTEISNSGSGGIPIDVKVDEGGQTVVKVPEKGSFTMTDPNSGEKISFANSDSETQEYSLDPTGSFVLPVDSEITCTQGEGANRKTTTIGSTDEGGLTIRPTENGVEITAFDGNDITINGVTYPNEGKELVLTADSKTGKPVLESGKISIPEGKEITLSGGDTVKNASGSNTIDSEGNIALSDSGDKITISHDGQKNSYTAVGENTKLAYDPEKGIPTLMAGSVELDRDSAIDVVYKKVEYGEESELFDEEYKATVTSKGTEKPTVNHDGTIEIPRNGVVAFDSEVKAGSDETTESKTAHNTVAVPKDAQNTTVSVKPKEDGSADIALATAGDSVTVNGMEYTTTKDDTQINITETGSTLTKGAVELDGGKKPQEGINVNGTCVTNSGTSGSKVTVEKKDDGTVGMKVDEGGTFDLSVPGVPDSAVTFTNPGTEEGSYTIEADGSIKFGEDSSIQFKTDSGKKTTVTGEEGVSMKVTELGVELTIEPGKSVTINGVKYEAAICSDPDKQTKLTVDSKGNVIVVDGAAKVPQGQPICVTNEKNELTKIQKKADSDVSQDSDVITVSAEGRIDAKPGDILTIGDGTYICKDTDGEFDLILNAETGEIQVERGTQIDITNGNLTFSEEEYGKIAVSTTGNKPIQAEKSSTNGKPVITIPSGGNAAIDNGADGTAVEIKVPADTTEKKAAINDEGDITVELKSGEKIIIAGIVYTADQDGTITVDAATGALKENTAIEPSEEAPITVIDAESFNKDNYEYQVKPGEKVQVDDVIYTAPESGSGMILKGNPNGNPIIEIGQAGESVEVGNQTYTTGSDNTKFVVNETNNVTLIDNGEASSNSSLKVDGSKKMIIDGNVITSSGKDGAGYTIMKTTNGEDALNIADGTKISVDMSRNGTPLNIQGKMSYNGQTMGGSGIAIQPPVSGVVGIVLDKTTRDKEGNYVTKLTGYDSTVLTPITDENGNIVGFNTGVRPPKPQQPDSGNGDNGNTDNEESDTGSNSGSQSTTIEEKPQEVTTTAEETSRTEENNVANNVEEPTENANTEKPVFTIQTVEEGKKIVVQEDMEVVLQNGKIAFQVSSQDGIMVGTVEQILTACFSEEEIEQIKNGMTAGVQASIVRINKKDVSESDRNLMQSSYNNYAKSIEGLEFGDYIDIQIATKLGDNDWKQLHELNGEVELVLDIPESLLAEGRTYYIMRNHNGECTLLEDLDEELQTITIATDRFSTYAIMYTDSNVEKLNIAQVDQTPKVTPWILFGVFVLLMILFGVLVERKRRSRVE